MNSTFESCVICELFEIFWMASGFPVLFLNTGGSVCWPKGCSDDRSVEPDDEGEPLLGEGHLSVRRRRTVACLFWYFSTCHAPLQERQNSNGVIVTSRIVAQNNSLPPLRYLIDQLTVLQFLHRSDINMPNPGHFQPKNLPPGNNCCQKSNNSIYNVISTPQSFFSWVTLDPFFRVHQKCKNV